MVLLFRRVVKQHLVILIIFLLVVLVQLEEIVVRMKNLVVAVVVDIPMEMLKLLLRDWEVTLVNMGL